MRLITLCAFLLFSAQTLSAADPHKISVSGNAVIHKPADKLSLRVATLTNDRSVESAIKSNNEAMQHILAALKKIGLSEDEYQTGTFTVNPQYAKPPKDPASDWRPTIVGYEVRNTLQIQTKKLDLAGTIIDASTKNGANLVDEIAFSLEDTESAQAEAITKAVNQAKIYAETAALAASEQLGDVLELTINPATVTPHFMKAERFAMANTAPPITAGEAEITASVFIVYEIRHEKQEH